MEQRRVPIDLQVMLDDETNTAYLRFIDEPHISHQLEVADDGEAPSILIDIAVDGAVAGIEFLDASRLLRLRDQPTNP